MIEFAPQYGIEPFIALRCSLFNGIRLLSKQVAQSFITGREALTDGNLNRVEAVIRCFDPCLSCSTHALGIVSSKIEIRDHNKKVIDVINRS